MTVVEGLLIVMLPHLSTERTLWQKKVDFNKLSE